MEKSWFVDGRLLAKKIKASGLPNSAHQVKDSGSNSWECPQCSCTLDILNESSEWPGLPSGVKFDPTDVELLDHLAAKCGAANDKPHEYLDVFIPTIYVEQGICYNHPENLPGARRDGNSFHLFYLTTNAYAKGHRKRRKVCDRSSLESGVRWHKTGKTKAVFKNGVPIGWKKIMVLYGTAVGGSNSKPCKMNWIMHQYHLGTNENEQQGEYVVAKIFYQGQKQQTGDSTNAGVSDEVLDPRTPMINASDPPRQGKTPLYEDDIACDYVIESPAQEHECLDEKHLLSLCTDELKDERNLGAAYGDDSKAIDLDVFYNSFSGEENTLARCSLSGSGFYTNAAAAAARGINLGTTPYVNLAELYFPCEDGFNGRLDWL